jgi:predicted RNase H-like HicB family nuclease
MPANPDRRDETTAELEPRREPRHDGVVKFRVLIEQDEDGAFVATCPSLPGCVSQGKTRAEARTHIEDAVAGYVASLKKHGEAIPPPIDEDVVEVSA